MSRWVLMVIAAGVLAGLNLPTAWAEETGDARVEIRRGEAPTWLVARAIPEARPELIARSSDGLSWLLIDEQVRAAQGGYDSYRRFAIRVNERSGLEAAGSLSIVFDPHTTRVTLDRVHVIREGKTVDHTADVKFHMAQREGDLENGIVDGVVTAVGNIANVRVGDVVDYSYTYHVSDRIWPGHFFDTESTSWSVPVGQNNMRVIWPTARPLHFRNINTDVKFAQSRLGADTVYELTQDEPPVQIGEDNIPSWFPAYGLVSISTMAEWSDVAAWAVPLYAGDESLPDDFVSDLDAIAARWPSPKDRLTEATRLVQDRIRYVGVEIAEGSFVPRRPGEVVRLGYGDCKDKSLLLAVALRRLGIAAVPALASTEWGKGIDGFAPSPGAFNHVIVRAELDGKPIWIDPTRSNQGGRGRAMTPPEYGFVLPIRPGQAALEKIAAFVPTRDRWHVLERYDVDPKAPETAVRLTVETSYRDGLAEWMRGRVATQPLSQIAKGNLDYYMRDLPGIVEAKPLVIEDDRDDNVVRMVESYTIDRGAFDKGDLAKEFKVRAYSIRDLLPSKQVSPRRNPLYVAQNERRTHVIELNVKGETFGALADFEKTAEGVHFRRTTTTVPEQQRMTYLLTSGEGTIAPANSASLYALSDAIEDESAWTYHFGTRSTAGFPASAGIAPEAVAPFAERIGQVGQLIQKEGNEPKLQALALLNAMTREAPRPSPIAGLIDGLKGTVLTMLNRLPAARTSLESSAAQYQANADMLYLLAALQLQDNDGAKAAETIGLVAKHQPEGLAKFEPDFVRGVMSTLVQSEIEANNVKADDLTIALARGGWQQSPRTERGDQVRNSAVRLLLERSEPADARKLFAAGPIGAEGAAALAADKRYAALWPDLDGSVRDRFKSLIAEDIERSGKALAAEPDKPELLQEHSVNLRRAGQAAKAADLLKAAAANREKVEAAGAPGFWMVNEYAYALQESGRPDDALKEMDWLVGLGLDNYPDLVSQAINKASMLNHLDRPVQALEAFDLLSVSGEQSASKYGKMWIQSGIVCAANALGKADRVAEAMKAMADMADTNPAAMTQALACRGDLDGLEALLIKRLDDPRLRGGVLGTFSTIRSFRRLPAFDTAIEGTLEKARSRPAVQAKFLSYGRKLVFDGQATYWGGL